MEKRGSEREKRGSDREEARKRSRRSAAATEKKRGSSGEEERAGRKKEEKTKVSMMIDNDRPFLISLYKQITNPISSISLVFLLVLAHPGGRREGQRRASIVSQ